MSEITEKTINVQTNPATFNKNIANSPKDKIVDTDPLTYKNAAADFIDLVTEKLSEKEFIEKHPELKNPVGMFKIVDNETHLNGGSTTLGWPVNGLVASAYVRNSVIENLAEDIAEAKYPIIDREKSLAMANAFEEAKTVEERKAAISKYGQLAHAFQLSDAMQTITNEDASDYVKEQITKGEVPQMTSVLRDAAERAELMHIKERIHPENEPGR